MKATKVAAVRLAVEALAVLVAAIVIAVYYGDKIEAINWRLVSFICIVAVSALGIYRWQIREDNDFDMLDVIATDKKLDNDKFYKAIFGGLAAWVIVQQALAGKDVSTLLLGVLGFYVAKAALDGFSGAMGRRPPPVDQSQNVNVLAGAKVEQKAAE
jgi:hypothetical protein